VGIPQRWKPRALIPMYAQLAEATGNDRGAEQDSS